MKFKQYLTYLTEKTFNIDKDVELLYNKGFKGVFKIVQENDLEQMQEKLKKLFRVKKELGSFTVLAATDSSILQSPDSVMAHNANPVNIELGAFIDGNFYRPSVITKRMGAQTKGIIQISLNFNVFNILIKGNIDTVEKSKMQLFANELTPTRIKSSISHELSHWISDSLHNSHISNVLGVAAELTNTELVKLGKKDVNMTYFEIDGQIHGIKEVKRANKDIWDQMTLLDLFTMYTSLSAIASNLKSHGKDVLDIWQKALVKRLAREKLLGKNMRNFVKPNEIK